MARRKSNHYVNNAELYAALIEYKKQIEEAEQSGDEQPQIPKYIAECIMMIARRLSQKPNFSSYSFVEDMQCAAILNCIEYIHNFNPEKSKNAFAYITQIIYYAFLRYIQKEKKNLYVTFKVIEQHEYMYDDPAAKATVSESSQEYMSDFVKSFEETKEKQRQKQKERKKGVGKFEKKE